MNISIGSDARFNHSLTNMTRVAIDKMKALPADMLISLGGEMDMVSRPDLIQHDAEMIDALMFLSENTPTSGHPVLFSREGDDVSVSFGGLKPSGFEQDLVSSTIASLDVIEDLLPEDQRANESELYAFGHTGRMNPDKRLMSAWARSPLEAVAKLTAQFTPGFGDDPMAAMAGGMEIKGQIEMRSVHDWKRHDVETLSKQLLKALDESLDGRRESEVDNTPEP